MKKILTLCSALCLLCSAAFAEDLPQILSAEDSAIYKQIFDLQRHEKIDDAKKLESGLTDKTLMPDVLYQRFFAKTYHTRGQEIVNWMYVNYNLPGADGLYKLSKIKQVQSKTRKPSLPTPIFGRGVDEAQSEKWVSHKYSSGTLQQINQFKRALRRGSTKNARDILDDKKLKGHLFDEDYGRLAGRLAFMYYADGNLDMAGRWGSISADLKSEYGLWTMGLLWYRNKDFGASEKYFAKILDLDQINDARKTEVAYWAGRAADAADKTRAAKKYWQIAAKRPQTFYGALANASLGDTPNYEFFEQDFDEDDINEIQKSKYGRSALALLQVGESARAEQYLRFMITSKASDKLLHAIHSLSTTNELPRTAMQVSSVVRDRGILEIDQNIISTAQYPLPDWEPMGGWSIDRALLFAITRQESGFKTTAKSCKGANGLMQIMPRTAKLVAKQNNVQMKNLDMTNPEHNMFLGQQYIVELLEQPSVDNNILKMLISYNGGIGALSRFEKKFDNDDPLLFIESFPMAETRNYVKRVMSNLWLYRARLDQPLTSLEDLANGQWPKYELQDDYVQNKIYERTQI